MKKKTVNVTMVEMEIEDRDELQKIADAAGRSMSKQAIKFVKYCFEKHPDSKLTNKGN